MTYDDIKSHLKPGLHAFSEKHIFGKTTGDWVKLKPRPSFLQLKTRVVRLIL